MLLGDVVIPTDVPLQRGKDAAVLQEGIAAVDLELGEGRVRLARVVCPGMEGGQCGFTRSRPYWRARRRDRKVFELLSQDDDSLLEEERVLHARVGEGRVEGEVAPGALPSGAVERVARGAKEVEDVFEAFRVELYA